MKSFEVDSRGDIVINNGNISIIEGAELTAQTVKTLLGTNKGEWFGNSDEGISFRNILGKNRTVVKASNTTSGSGSMSSQSQGMTETEELALAARLQRRLDGDT